MVRLTRPDNVRARVLCFPFAGGEANAFFTWARGFPADVEVSAVEYPGRAGQAPSPADLTVTRLGELAAAAIRPPADAPIGVLGYSYGAVVAFEWLRALERAGAPPVSHFFVCSRRAPHLPPSEPPLHALADRDFVSAVQAHYGGIPAVILAEPELLARFVPVLRADLRLLETYEHVPGPALRCPITAIRGSADRTATREALAAWGEHSSAGCELIELPGDHFFLRTAGAALRAAMLERLLP